MSKIRTSAAADQGGRLRSSNSKGLTRAARSRATTTGRDTREGETITKEKIQKLIDQQRTNLDDVTYLDLDSISNIVDNFENPSLPEDINDKKSATTVDA